MTLTIQLGMARSDTAETRQDALFEMGASESKIESAENGKPYLSTHAGFSITRFRQDFETVALLAVSENSEIGIDAEPWPDQRSDADFLQTVSAPEDSKVLNHLDKWNRDSGTALWVIKEAALKCSGEVMTDPRHLAVKLLAEDRFHVAPSAMAGAPHPDIHVQLLVLESRLWPILLGFAYPAQKRPMNITFRPQKSSNLQSLNHLVAPVTR